MKTKSLLPLLAISFTVCTAPAGILITEVNSNGNGGDFFELYNSGSTPVSLNGWKFDDDSANPADTAAVTLPNITLPAGGVLVVMTDAVASAAETFRTQWGLPASVQIFANGGPGLGKEDAVVVFNAAGQVATAFNYKKTASITATDGTVIPPFTRNNGQGPNGDHAGISAGGTLAGASAVWDGVSVTSPRYVNATVGTLKARAQSSNPSTIGSPGTNGLVDLEAVPPIQEPPAPGPAPDTETLAAGQLRIRELSSISLAGSEISAFDPASKRIFVTCNEGIQVIDLSNPLRPVVLSTIAFNTAEIGLNATDVTSVAAHNGTLAVAVPNAVKQNPGHVVFLNAANGAYLGKVQVGILPDHVTFTPDGTKVLTADEGEMLTDGTDPSPGTVTIIDVSAGFGSAQATSVGFAAFDSQAQALKDAGVRIFQEGGALKLPSLDFEPEYLAVSHDGKKAMVTLQEANAVALLDIESASFTEIVPLGEKDFSTLLADFSDRDGPGNTNLIQHRLGHRVFGLYMPDAIASYEANGQTYYVMANEGDDRNDFMNPGETTTVGSAGYVLDATVFPDAATLKEAGNLGRLTVSNSPGLRGDTDGDGDIDRILAYGGRSFSIVDSSGTRVYDSGSITETVTAAMGPQFHDDSRNDNKGTEPEGVQIGVVNGKTYAFVALERARSVIAFDVTNPENVSYAGIAGKATDANPEAITFISAAQSPNGQPLIAVTNETSNTLTIYSVAPYTLQLLHLSDGEAGLLAAQTAPNLAALVDAFDGTYDNTLILSGGDNFIPSPFLSAGTDPSLNAVTSIGKTAFARPDIAIHNQIGVEASAIGNHEWDLGSAVFTDAIRPDGAWLGANFPHISLNLDYSADSAANGRFTNVPLDGTTTSVPEASANKGRLVPTAVITKGGQKIGLVGVTTQLIESISSPSGTKVKGFPTGASATDKTDNMDLLASQVQPYIDELAAEGVNKIILLSHLQQITNEQSLATKLQGVDVILAAGSNTRLGDSDDVASAFPGHEATFAGPYPIITAGTDGVPTLIVNTDNEYTYLGRLVVDFDAHGQIVVPELANRVSENGAYASTEANVAAAWNVSIEDLETTAFAPGTKGANVKEITEAVQSVIDDKDGTVYGYTTVYLEGERAFVRSEETNLGNITADANASALRTITGAKGPIVSLKNGGGIRAQIGAVSSAGGSSTKLPPPANPTVGKAEGGVSQLDIENALRFDNKLIAFETTPAGLKAILEHGVALWPNQGRFPQVGGVSFGWDPDLTAGSRITSISLIDDQGLPAAAIYKNASFVPNAPEVITMVTLNFLANDGDGYPMKANGSNFRYLLTGGSLGPILNEANDFTAAPSLPTNPVGEQKVFADYLTLRYGSAALAFTGADTSAALDVRIQNLNYRSDSVLPYTGEQVWTLNAYAEALASLGLSPSVAITSPQLVAAIAGTRISGQDDVTSNPGSFELYDEDSIQDLRGAGNLLVRAAGNVVELTLPVQKSNTLDEWTDGGELKLVFPKTQDKEFYRLELPR